MAVITEILKCDVCGSELDDRIKLAEHAWIHATRKYRCPGCLQTFCTALARVRHDCWIKCEICSAEFESLRSVNKHKTFVHPTRRRRLDLQLAVVMFECAKCHKKFDKKKSWLGHCRKVCAIQ